MKLTAKQVYAYVNDHEHDDKAPKDAARPGLSFGMLSAYHSLYKAIHQSAAKVLIELDKFLGQAEDTPAARDCWNRYMEPLPFPAVDRDSWSASRVIFPFAWLYGQGQLSAKQTEVYQLCYFVKLLYHWFGGGRLNRTP